MNNENRRSAPAQLRRLIQQDGVVVAPGVYDGISARMALKSGHKALYVTGAGTSASHLGRADLGFLSMNDVLHVAGIATGLGSVIATQDGQPVPVIADADTGFGASPQVARTVEEYHRAGIAALHIEDQVPSKRCGHLDSKQLVSTNDFLARISAAVLARNRLAGKKEDKILIIARTDAIAVNGMNDAMDRMQKAKELGADIGFVEGMRNDEQVHTAIQRLSSDGWPMLANCVSGGVSPLWTANDVLRLGFRIAIFPCAGMFPAMRALEHSYSHLLQQGIGAEAAQPTSQDRFVDLYQSIPVNSTPLPLTIRQFFVNMGLEEEMQIDSQTSQSIVEGVQH